MAGLRSGSPLRAAPGARWLMAVLRASAPAALALAPLGLLWSFRGIPFVADDFFFCTQSFPLTARDLLTRGWGHAIGATAGYRPVALLSYSLTYALAGADPVAFRLTNFLLHGVAAALVVAVAARVTRSAPVSWLAGVLFVLHPIHHENVLWISGRTFPLATVFVLLSLLSLRETGSPVGWRPQVRDLLAGGTGLCALLAYEGAVSLPLVAFLYGLSANWDDPKRLRRALGAALPAAAALAIYLGLRWVFVSDLPSDARQLVAASAGLRFDPRARLARNGASLLLRLFACGSCPIRPFYTSRTFWLTSVLFLLAIWHGRRAKGVGPGLLFGIGVTLAGYAPFAVYVGYTDRFAYLASVGFIIALAAVVIAAIGETWAANRWRAALIGMLTVACGVLWLRQLTFTGEYWREAGRLADTLLAKLVQVVPDPPAGRGRRGHPDEEAPARPASVPASRAGHAHGAPVSRRRFRCRHLLAGHRTRRAVRGGLGGVRPRARAGRHLHRRNPRLRHADVASPRVGLPACASAWLRHRACQPVHARSTAP
jgi:hypothetical protein